MKPIILILKNIKNLLPYFLLIAIYFFFISLEAKKENKLKNFVETENDSFNENKLIEENQIRINIPVVPYNERNTN